MSRPTFSEPGTGGEHCFLVCYDIAHNKRRAKVAKCLCGFGRRIQESVFEALLDTGLFDIMVARLSKLIDPARDSVVIYPLPPSVSARRQELGLAARPRPNAVNCIVI